MISCKGFRSTDEILLEYLKYSCGSATPMYTLIEELKAKIQAEKTKTPDDSKQTKIENLLISMEEKLDKILWFYKR